MTLASTDTGSLKNFQNGTKRRKARQIFGGVKAYLFVDKSAVYIHVNPKSS
jgi:hypothetical protein